jgi:hypothetical protein
MITNTSLYRERIKKKKLAIDLGGERKGKEEKSELNNKDCNN